MFLREPVSPALSLQLFQITIGLAQHPNRERELEVRIRDRDRPVEHPLDRFLRPRTVLQTRAKRKREFKSETELVENARVVALT